MRDRTLTVAWIVVALVFALILLYELGKWRSLSTEGGRAAVERVRLSGEIRGKEEEIVKEMRGSAGLLQEMQWSAAGGDPSAFLTRLAELASEKRMKVIGIGNLERQATAQFNKSWHPIQVVAPYRELRDLAARVEGQKGILEDMSVTAPKGVAPGASRSDEVEAKFKMTALELTTEAKKILERALAASGAGPQPAAPGPALALPLPITVAGAVPARDPFAFGAAAPAPGTPVTGARPGPRARPAAGAPAAAPAAPRVETPKAVMELRGVVSFPGGFLAIVNNQIVKAGDSLSGHRVERITDDTVVLREPDGGTRTISLPGLAQAPPAGLRR
ncbi:MAG: hypothetical protein A2X52_05150 [Candidatus Rokubacteria bacterium GWC2_70_16]|nr:MAG: hypothetical protein A2X52_05150 [Candidatus Rokubacteria bacterium GWC2_70_16]